MLRIENLSHRYPGMPANALEHVSFEIAAGESLGLLGPNGAGKTTLMSLLAGLLPIQKGEVTFDGKPIGTTSRDERQRLSLVPQDFAFYPMLTVQENVRFFASLYQQRDKGYLDDLIRQAGLAPFADRLARHLSGGLKRRLNFAIGLINRPSLLFLDEITVGIDPESRHFILENVASLNRAGTTVVYTSHYLQEIESLCSSLLLLNRGMLIYEGRLDEILNRSVQNRLVFKPLRPLTPAELSSIRGRLTAGGAVEVLADQPTAMRIWQELDQRGTGFAYFHAGHGSLESFYLNFLQQHTPS
ncbi:MAG: ABC transporter ATP-binding protein [Lautropia sp.]|nr:ABC transporter ATP-binding protein [Lautropia sp.]